MKLKIVSAWSGKNGTQGASLTIEVPDIAEVVWIGKPEDFGPMEQPRRNAMRIVIDGKITNG